MIDKVITGTIILISVAYLGRRFYRQWRAAFDKKNPISCGQGCCSCSTAATCATQNDENQLKS